MIGVYMLIQLGIGMYAARGVKNEADFVLAGRSIGLVLGMFSMFATNFGAETVMGTAAAVAEDGLAGGRADPFGYTICWILMAIFVAYQLRSRAYVTIGDFFRDRYNGFVEKLVVLIILPASLIWAAAQMMAFGQILAVVSNVPVSQAIIFATALVVVYTFLGGMLGDILTDLVQGIVLIAGIFVLGWFVMEHAGGMTASLATIEPEQLRFSRPGETLLQRLDTWMIPILGSLVMQEAVGRILSMRSPQLARKAALGSAAMYLVVGLVPVYIALVGAHFNFQIEHRDEYLPDLAQNLLPLPMFVIFIGALMSAILSTVNSTLLAFATLISQNLVFPYLRNRTQKRELWITRALILLAGPITCVLALGGENIFEMAQLSSSFGVAGVLAAFFCGMWFRRGGPVAATAALVAGMTVTILGNFVYDGVWEAPFLYSIVAAAIAYAAGMAPRRQDGAALHVNARRA
jgi:SSS family transporter